MNHLAIKELLCELGKAVCERVHHALLHQTAEQRAAVYKEAEDDIIYQIDKDVEDILLPLLEAHAEALGGIVLIAEGIGDVHAGMVLPSSMREDEAALKIIIDPIDGTRGIMYNKRSAFFLAGVAPNRGSQTSLQDIEVAVMTELPTSRSILSDTLWAIRGQGAFAFTRNIQTHEITQQFISPSRATSLLGGFGQLSRFFPPGRALLAQLEDELIEAISPTVIEGRAVVFEDQYISSGGQLYELLMGHDRFIGELRTVLYAKLAKQGIKAGHVCHPYDVCTMLIAEEAGLCITDAYGDSLNVRLNVLDAVDWIGYANPKIQAELEPHLQRLMKQYGLI